MELAAVDPNRSLGPQWLLIQWLQHSSMLMLALGQMISFFTSLASDYLFVFKEEFSIGCQPTNFDSSDGPELPWKCIFSMRKSVNVTMSEQQGHTEHFH